jgi:hypothetical protein
MQQRAKEDAAETNTRLQEKFKDYAGMLTEHDDMRATLFVLSLLRSEYFPTEAEFPLEPLGLIKEFIRDYLDASEKFQGLSRFIIQTSRKHARIAFQLSHARAKAFAATRKPRPDAATLAFWNILVGGKIADYHTILQFDGLDEGLGDPFGLAQDLIDNLVKNKDSQDEWKSQMRLYSRELIDFVGWQVAFIAVHILAHVVMNVITEPGRRPLFREQELLEYFSELFAKPEGTLKSLLASAAADKDIWEIDVSDIEARIGAAFILAPPRRPRE